MLALREGVRVSTQDHPRRLVSTAKAAAAVDVSRTTLWRWYERGLVKPSGQTPTGHLRWDIDELQAQLHRIRELGEEDQ